MALTVTKIPAAECRRTLWKNGGGWTTEVAIEPAGAHLGGDFDWRVSIADIEQDGPFSIFPGVERDLFMLRGNGIELNIDGSAQRLDRALQRIHFSGDSEVHCRLLNGATRDFNVMVRARSIVAYIAATEPLQDLAIAGPIGSQWLVHCCSGDATLALDGQTIRLNAGDSARIDSPDNAGEFSISSTGRLLVVRFTPRGSEH
ncbi:MAG: HutD family protein [Dokdonella sp.]